MAIISSERLFSEPADFDSPIAILVACHARIEQRLATLRRLAQHLQAHGADAQARTAAASILRYFDEAAPRHHEDEEHDLLPALRAAPLDAQARARLEAVSQTVLADHAAFDALWQPVAPVLRALAAGQAAGRLDAAAVEALSDRYRDHIRLEEEVLFAEAARVLDADTLRRLAHAMQARRGLRPAGPPGPAAP